MRSDAKSGGTSNVLGSIRSVRSMSGGSDVLLLYSPKAQTPRSVERGAVFKGA